MCQKCISQWIEEHFATVIVSWEMEKLTNWQLIITTTTTTTYAEDGAKICRFKLPNKGRWLDAMFSVTRLNNFLKFLVAWFLSKVAQMRGKILGRSEKQHFSC